MKAEENTARPRPTAPGEMPEQALWMFPGQGAQAPGMGARMLATYPPAARLVERAEELTGLSLREPCLRGPQERLNASEVLQPLWTALLLGCASRLREAGLRPMAVAGHSLGEWSALAAAGVISDDDALRLAARRGLLMAHAAETSVGAMLAVLELDAATVHGLVEEVRREHLVVVANDNSPRQQVVSGDPEGVAKVARRVAEAGGRSRGLDVAGAWHCPSPGLIEAAEAFRHDIEATEFRRAEVPVFLNTLGAADVDPVVIRRAMVDQIVSPVRWRELIGESFAWGCRNFLEVGPSKVLRSLLRQIFDDPGAYGASAYDGAGAPKRAAAPARGLAGGVTP